MKVMAHFHGGPHDGAACELDAPFPLVISLFLNGVLADYHYHGFKDGTAGYGIAPVAVQSIAA